MSTTQFWRLASQRAWGESTYFKYAGPIATVALWILLLTIAKFQPGLIDAQQLKGDWLKIAGSVVVSVVLSSGEFLFRLVQSPCSMYSEALESIAELEKKLAVDPIEESRRAHVRKILECRHEASLGLVRSVWSHSGRGRCLLGEQEAHARIVSFELATAGVVIRQRNPEDPFGRMDTFLVAQEYTGAVDAVLREHGV